MKNIPAEWLQMPIKVNLYTIFRKKPREKKDFGPYMDVLDKLADSNLQYVIAKTGVKLGIDQPISVAKARIAQNMAEKKTSKLDQKILKRLQSENGQYKKRIDKFLEKP